MMVLPRNRDWIPPASDLLLVAVLIALGVAGRLLPHLPIVTPVAASALFASRVLRVRALAFVVPVAAMALSDAALGFYDWRVMLVVYAALAVPALGGCLFHRLRATGIAAIVLSSSLIFFIASNFAVWAFSGMYANDLAGLIVCYVAALPFLKYAVAGDAVWAAALFGCHRLIQSDGMPRGAVPAGRSL